MLGNGVLKRHPALCIREEGGIKIPVSLRMPDWTFNWGNCLEVGNSQKDISGCWYLGLMMPRTQVKEYYLGWCCLFLVIVAAGERWGELTCSMVPWAFPSCWQMINYSQKDTYLPCGESVGLHWAGFSNASARTDLPECIAVKKQNSVGNNRLKSATAHGRKEIWFQRWDLASLRMHSENCTRNWIFNKCRVSSEFSCSWIAYHLTQLLPPANVTRAEVTFKV